jgi:hypothetical protein
MKGASDFRFEDGVFRFLPAIPEEQREAFQTLVRELVEWRLAEYLNRAIHADGSNTEVSIIFTLKVSHSNGRPLLFLPSRDQARGLPEGWQALMIDGQRYRANFVKVAINVIQPADGEDNVIARVLRGWFGADAGLPGTDFKVSLARDGDANWIMEPMGRHEGEGIVLFKTYSREQIPPLFGLPFNDALWNAGYVKVTAKEPRHLCLLVTLDKAGMANEHQYGDRFLSIDQFEWHSQNRTQRASRGGELL